MDQVTALARALAKAPCPQVDPSDGVPVGTGQIAEGALRVKSACQTFGPFRFHPARHLLLEGETLVRLGSRVLEILAALVERPGEMVSKDELIARVWPKTVVEESNLKVNVCALRRALGEGRPGRRYIAT
ncbi:MAG: winged helix-turn-helix domain-containing protein, partial [Acetobacteraceae bacterium]|nr:winged helix-turn-helix domain-containing protein [Acetobacteraceae bacterium]